MVTYSIVTYTMVVKNVAIVQTSIVKCDALSRRVISRQPLSKGACEGVMQGGHARVQGCVGWIIVVESFLVNKPFRE